MAYFLPVGGVLKALLRAPRRGVLVRVVVPGQSDVPLVQHATRHLYAWLLKRRIRIFERQGSMLHSKVMIVDRAWSVLGSCNLDARSLRINLEFLAVIHSRPLALALEEIVAYEIAHSERVTPQSYRERSWWRRPPPPPPPPPGPPPPPARRSQRRGGGAFPSGLPVPSMAPAATSTMRAGSRYLRATACTSWGVTAETALR
jgi:phosphatidylserine/phosphatidylglycerophosphate/cardiolipin synthase-like enzyme